MKATVLFILMSLLVQCQKTKEKKMPATDFYISEQKITYKNQELPFGKPVVEWVKIFGEYNRRPFKSVYIWDKLGFHISESDYNDNIDELHIFFMNLDSPLAEEGVLDYAEGYYMKTDKDPKNYEYPFTTYKKPLNIEGAEVKIGMKISDINNKRRSADLETIDYIDANANSTSERGPNDEADGYFSNYGSKSRPHDLDPKVQNNFYHIMFRQTSGEVEYIRIVQDKGQEYFRY